MGSASRGNPADHEAATAGKDAGGRFDTLFDDLQRPTYRLRFSSGAYGVQSLPEKLGVLCPPGTRSFRGLFFARLLTHFKFAMKEQKNDGTCGLFRPSRRFYGGCVVVLSISRRT